MASLRHFIIDTVYIIRELLILVYVVVTSPFCIAATSLVLLGESDI